MRCNSGWAIEATAKRPELFSPVSSSVVSTAGVKCVRYWGLTFASPASRRENLKLKLPLSASSRKAWKPHLWAARIAMACEDSRTRNIAEKDLLIVGPGLLGSLVAKLWLKENEGSKVVGESKTTARHEELRAIGIVPAVKDANNTEKFSYVIFCAPPPGISDYPAEVRAAAQRWNGEGSLLFTSSSAVYDVDDNGFCKEESAPCVPKGRSSRTDKLLDAEEEVLKVGGNVVRFAGLYTLNRGTHIYYLSAQSVASRGDHIVNVIHYEDAATLSLAILKAKSRGQIYMGCDNVPLSRLEIMDAVNKSGKYEKVFKEFTSVDGPLGKRMNNSATREATGWEPQHKSFLSFLGVTISPDLPAGKH